MKTVNNIFKHTFFCLALGTTVCSCDLDVEPTSNILDIRKRCMV